MLLRTFVVVSGLPGSGKTTLGRQLAAILDLPLIDKDDILEKLFTARGVGDTAWRRSLSRESDAILAHDAARLDGAVLSSFWRLEGMPADSGTPTEWLHKLPSPLVHVQCVVDPEVAARRFSARTRHAGHLDERTSFPRLLADLRTLAQLAPLNISPHIVVDTSDPVSAEHVASLIRAALRHA